MADSSTDAKILFTYLSKRPYQSPGARPNTTDSQPKPLSLPSLKLYKRTNWHTCPCFFSRIAVLHPRPGPSRPTFGCAGKYCARCSSAAILLRPMRRGGPMDQNTRNDPYWNRCVFLGASGVFESSTTEEIGEGNGTHLTPQPQQASRPVRRDFEAGSYRKSGNRREDGDCEPRRRQPFYEELDPRSCRDTERRNRRSSRTSRYQADLDSYLEETYGKKRG
ncbi:hypothetical protein CLCR_03689 [Cladophialophora carrionii]|uniref:Uncharacterized protein n=1 Tax=Cladophialophora carrionii TaxID=86049 RepID=A0A1C1CGV0_9EURO|nr:hypothetical protein CLCR_03689 [Cladophialophora carrionii]